VKVFLPFIISAWGGILVLGWQVDKNFEEWLRNEKTDGSFQVKASQSNGEGSNQAARQQRLRGG
jgi:hypothetical protein